MRKPQWQLAWHFTRSDSRGNPVLRDGRPVIPGKWLRESGPIEICWNGLHSSLHAVDALRYVSWNDTHVSLVEVDGIQERDREAAKIVSRRRRPLFCIPADEILMAFARDAALSVIHQWPEAPASVREFLETGDPKLYQDVRSYEKNPDDVHLIGNKCQDAVGMAIFASRRNTDKIRAYSVYSTVSAATLCHRNDITPKTDRYDYILNRKIKIKIGHILEQMILDAAGWQG